MTPAYHRRRGLRTTHSILLVTVCAFFALVRASAASPRGAPVAAFKSSCTMASCTLDAHASTGRIATYAWHASDAERPDKNGVIITRNNTAYAGAEWDETLTVTDSAGKTATVTHHVAFPATTSASSASPNGAMADPSPASSAISRVAPVTQSKRGGFVYGAELPRSVPVEPPGLSSAACTSTVSFNLQGALNRARGGDVLCLRGTFQGTYTLPPRGDTGWVVLRGAQAAPMGARVEAAPGLARIETTGGGSASALIAAVGSKRWYIHSLDIGVAPSVTARVGAIVELFGSDLWLDRVYVHPGPNQEVQRCVSLQAVNSGVIHSQLRECHAKGFDAQAIAGWNGAGPFLIDDNTLEGGGENLMFGGADPATPNLVPSDITVTRNWIITPPSWKGVWTKKNLLELKNAERVLVEGNVLDGSWRDAQTGTALMYFSINQSGRCRWCRVGDVVTRGNLFKNVGMGWNISGTQDLPVDTPARRLVFVANVIDSLKYGDGDGILIQVLGRGRDLVIDSLVASANVPAFKQTLGVESSNPWTNVTVMHVVASLGRYGIFCSGAPAGEASFGCFGGTKIYRAVTLVGARTNGYSGTAFAPRESAVPLAAAIRARVAAATAGVVR